MSGTLFPLILIIALWGQCFYILLVYLQGRAGWVKSLGQDHTANNGPGKRCYWSCLTPKPNFNHSAKAHVHPNAGYLTFPVVGTPGNKCFLMIHLEKIYLALHATEEEGWVFHHVIGATQRIQRICYTEISHFIGINLWSVVFLLTISSSTLWYPLGKNLIHVEFTPHHSHPKEKSFTSWMEISLPTISEKDGRNLETKCSKKETEHK